MADFCKQCSIELFGEDFGDFKGLTTSNVAVLCEGCGPTSVDFKGECIHHKGRTQKECLADAQKEQRDEQEG